MQVPVDVGRDEARRAAHRELGKAIYRQHQPSALQRLLDHVMEWLNHLAGLTSGTTASGWFGLVVVVVLVAGVAVLVWRRTGGLQRSRRRGRAALLETDAQVTAAQQRALAARHAAAEQWAEAIRDRMRAIALGLEERALLDHRSGRTADEVATDAAPALPGQAAELREAARIFDDVWYGEHDATRAAYDRITRVDERVRDAKPVLTGTPS
ncbi:MAG: DUF4129 domain-containing protein [Streptosporangiales bacterium]|nr:DUF4129 domain-containing protein [Streptosporangiales bacterium]MBO0890947.1 DUF4129 domain-containing protein [Acidothermales bacterium]